MGDSVLKDKRVCRVCDSDTSKHQWFRDGLGFYICFKCYARLIAAPLYRARHPDKIKAHHERWAGRLIKYKGR